MTLNTAMAHAMADAQRKSEAKPEILPAYLRVYRAIVALRRASPQQISDATKSLKGRQANTWLGYLTQELSRKLEVVHVILTLQCSIPMLRLSRRSESRCVTSLRLGEIVSLNLSLRLFPVVSVPPVEDTGLLRLEPKFSPEAIVENLTLKECKELFTYLGTFFK